LSIRSISDEFGSGAGRGLVFALAEVFTLADVFLLGDAFVFADAFVLDEAGVGVEVASGDGIVSGVGIAGAIGAIGGARDGDVITGLGPGPPSESATTLGRVRLADLLAVERLLNS